MFNKNVFTQKDPIADLIKGINEADYKAKMEALKGNQHKLDKNKNNKVDADDFKILRGEKKVNEDQVEEAAESPFTSWKKPRQPEPSGGSGIKQGTRYGGSKQKDKPEQDDEKVKKEEIDPKKVTTDTLAGVVKGKTANPFAPKKVMIDVAGNVNEEELNEISDKTLGNYVKAARKDREDNKVDMHSGDADQNAAARERDKKRRMGINKAKAYLTPGTMGHAKNQERRLANEEVEELDEGLGHFVVKQMARLANKSDLQDHHINVAQKKVNSDLGTGHPQADNILNKHKKLARDAQYHKKSDDEARQHFADNMQTLHNDLKSARSVKEEAEQIDEKVISSELQTIQGNHVVNSQTHTHPDAKHGVSRDTLVHKGTISSKGGSNKKKFEIHNHPNHGLVFKTNHTDDEKQSIKKHLIYNKMAGKGTAISEEVEELDERELSKGETAEKERIVKGMKKSLAGFKARYGDKAKSVMYATATKAAKKD
jgi:hypothetical protein